MKSFVTSLVLLGAVLAAGAPAFAQTGKEKKPATPPAESQVIAKARAEYPMKTCIVSDEPLGSMGDAVPYVHHVAGQPDRVVFFCCEGCIDDFKGDPAKYLKKLDDVAKNKGAKSAEKSAAEKAKAKH